MKAGMKWVALLAFFPALLLADAEKPPEREVLKLSPEQEAHVRYEMRGFLVALQGIHEALAKQDFEAVARYARQSGAAAPQSGPRGLGKALPQRFREMGSATHAAFDQIAVDAATMGDTRVVLEQVSGIMKTCIQCHATYRFAK